MFHTCKITVVKRAFDMELADLFAKNPERCAVCDLVEDDQEFTVSNPYEKPEGLCAYAWADMRPQILAIASGGTFEFLKDENTALATCTDMLRPVIFKIERVDEE